MKHTILCIVIFILLFTHSYAQNAQHYLLYANATEPIMSKVLPVIEQNSETFSQWITGNTSAEDTARIFMKNKTVIETIISELESVPYDASLTQTRASMLDSIASLRSEIQDNLDFITAKDAQQDEEEIFQILLGQINSGHMYVIRNLKAEQEFLLSRKPEKGKADDFLQWKMAVNPIFEKQSEISMQTETLLLNLFFSKITETEALDRHEQIQAELDQLEKQFAAIQAAPLLRNLHHQALTALAVNKKFHLLLNGFFTEDPQENTEKLQTFSKTMKSAVDTFNTSIKKYMKYLEEQQAGDMD